MSVQQNARCILGALIKKQRATEGLNRGVFASMVGVELVVIQRLEHGVVNPTRSEIVRAINLLNFSKEEKNKAYDLLRIFSPRRKKNQPRLSRDPARLRHMRNNKGR